MFLKMLARCGQEARKELDAHILMIRNTVIIRLLQRWPQFHPMLHIPSYHASSYADREMHPDFEGNMDKYYNAVQLNHVPVNLFPSLTPSGLKFINWVMF